MLILLVISLLLSVFPRSNSLVVAFIKGMHRPPVPQVTNSAGNGRRVVRENTSWIAYSDSMYPAEEGKSNPFNKAFCRSDSAKLYDL